MAREEYKAPPGDYSRNAGEQKRLDAARSAQAKIDGPFFVNVITKEVEKPDGGGLGKEADYILEVVIDGRIALTLRRDHFKEAGQLDRFTALINARKPQQKETT